MAWPFARREERAAGAPAGGPSAFPRPEEMTPVGALAPRIDQTNFVSSVSTAYACIRILADTVASCRIDAYENKPGAAVPSKMATPPMLLTQPCAEFDAQTFITSSVWSQAVDGNIFWGVVSRDARGFATQLMVLDPGKVKVERKDGRLVYKVAGKEQPDGAIIHIPWLVPPGGVRGISPIEVNAKGLQWGASLQEFATSVLANGATPTGVIELPAEATIEDAKRVKMLWDSKHRGVTRAGGTALLTGGATYQALQLTPEALQLLASKSHSDNDIARIFGVPSHLLSLQGPTTMAQAGLGELGRQFITQTLTSYLSRIENALSRELGPNIAAKFYTADLTRLDRKSLVEVLASAKQAGLMTTNEARLEMGLPPVDGGDTLLEPLNLGPAGGTGAPLMDRVNAAATLVRTGYDPAHALRVAGLDDMDYLDVQPVTVRPKALNDAQAAYYQGQGDKAQAAADPTDPDADPGADIDDQETAA